MKTEGVSSYHVDNLRVDVEQHQVTRDGNPITLPELSYRLLCRLCEEAPAPVHKDDIAESVWEHGVVSDETIAQRVRLLRKSIGDEAGQVVVAVRGVGYRLARPTTVSARRGLRAPVTSVDAYNAYLLGRHFAFELTASSLEKAINYLQDAIRREPEFAEAHCALGWAWCFLGSEYGNRPPSACFQKAKSAALSAISLDPGSAEAHSLLADIFCWYDWDFAAAEREHRVAITTDPNACLGYALMLSALKRSDEAIALLEDRLHDHPDDEYVKVNLAWRYLEAGRLDEAISLASDCRGRNDASLVLADALICQARPGDAVAVLTEDTGLNADNPARLALLVRALAAQGCHDDAEMACQQLHQLTTHRYVSPYLLATTAMALDDVDLGFDYLEQAFNRRAREMIFLGNSTAFTAVKDDPRYHSRWHGSGSREQTRNCDQRRIGWASTS